MVAAVREDTSFSKVWDKLFAKDSGLSNALQTVEKIIKVIASCLASIPPQLAKCGEMLKSTKSVLDVFEFISDIKYWICDHSPKSSQLKTAAKALGTVASSAGLIGFLEIVGAVNLNSLAGAMGGVPILGTVLSAFAVVSLSVGLASKSVELHESINKVKNIKQEIAELSGKLEGTPDGRSLELTMKVQELAHAKKARTKAWLAVALDIGKIALNLLIFVGFLAGIGFLASTGIPLLAAASALAIFGLSKFIYEQVHPKQASVAQDRAV